MTLEILLKHTFPNFTADVDFIAPTPGVVALFGPSGCGKSTVMSAVAGLLRADEVRVILDGVVLSDLHPADRGIGVVFQDGRLFPHTTVAANLRYGMRRAPAGPVGFEQTVELLGIGHLLKRRPAKLSGGERQRVAIGRALLRQPRLLLMDEPLSALDAARKGEILPFLQRLHDEMHIPMLLVTHSIEEVARLADTLVLMEKGSVAANGPVGEVLARADLPFATGNQAGAVIPARVVAHDVARSLTKLDAAGVTMWVPLMEAAPGSTLRVRRGDALRGEVGRPERLGDDHVGIHELALQHAVGAVLVGGDHQRVAVLFQVGPQAQGAGDAAEQRAGHEVDALRGRQGLAAGVMVDPGQVIAGIGRGIARHRIVVENADHLRHGFPPDGWRFERFGAPARRGDGWAVHPGGWGLGRA